MSTSYTVRALMPGAVALARETGAPLLPMAIWGPQRILTAGPSGGWGCEHQAWQSVSTLASILAAARLCSGPSACGSTLEGDEHVPVTGPVVLASNHVSFLDFLLVGLAAAREPATSGSWPATRSGPTPLAAGR